MVFCNFLTVLTPIQPTRAFVDFFPASILRKYCFESFIVMKWLLHWGYEIYSTPTFGFRKAKGRLKRIDFVNLTFNDFILMACLSTTLETTQKSFGGGYIFSDNSY